MEKKKAIIGGIVGGVAFTIAVACVTGITSYVGDSTMYSSSHETYGSSTSSISGTSSGSNRSSGSSGGIGWSPSSVLSDAGSSADGVALSSSSSNTQSFSIPSVSMPSVSSSAFDYEENHTNPAAVESGFISTKAQHLSTLSADVDTASYSNIRNLISNNQVPDVDDVRVEEMLNYFDYDYEAPRGSDKFSISKQVAQTPWNEDTQLVALGFASAPETESKEKGSNLVFLIDVSGSMGSEDKLPLLQDSFAKLVGHLSDKDKVSIVTYSGQEKVVIEGVSGENKDKIQKAVDNLSASGSTNGEAGLKMAYQVSRDNYIEGGVNRIVMASDGDLNVGMTSKADLHDFVDKKKEQGIYLSVLGFGDGNYKDETMETLADHGNGNYHYIDSIEEAERVLDEKLMANLVPFANDVKIQVDFNPSQVKAYRLIGYENRALDASDFKDDAKDAGEVGPSQQFTVLYEVVPQSSDLTLRVLGIEDYGDEQGRSTDEWMTVSMRYKLLDGNLDFFSPEIQEQTLDVSEADISTTPDDNWTFAAGVAQAGMVMRSSSNIGSATMGDAIKLAETATGNDDLKKEFVSLMKDLDRMAYGNSYNNEQPQKRNNMANQNENVERVNNVNDANSNDNGYFENRTNKSNESRTS